MHLQGTADAHGLRIAIVVSRFNDFVTDRLLAGALEALGAAGARRGSIDACSVPGASEIPQAARDGGVDRVATTRSSASAASSGARRRTSSTSPRPWPTASCAPRRRPTCR